MSHMDRPGESLKSSDVRDHNLGLVLASLEKAGSASRTQLAETTGLVRGALTALIAELIEVGLVRTSPVDPKPVEVTPPPRARAGRPQEKLELDGSRLAVLGVQFTPDRIHLCVVDLAGRSLLRRELAFRAPYGDPEALVAILVEQMEEVFASKIVGSPSIVQWVFAVPAPVFTSTGVIPIAIDLGWHDVDLARLVSDRIGVPRLGIRVVNDANAATYAEFNSLWRNPETAGVTDLIYLKSDTGIGGGAIVAGSILLGANGFAFEPGHVSVVPDGIECECGRRGCLVTVAGPERVVSLAGLDAYAVDNGLEAALQEVVRRFRASESAAVAAVGEAVRWLRLVLENLVVLFEPQYIVLGGYLAEIVDEFSALPVPVHAYTNPWATSGSGPEASERPPASSAALGALDGAILQARHDLLSSPGPLRTA
ncbi:Sugar kinase of the NBD/HSP70 family, may contain an N-terminal HTH domain [Agreia pratensis]|uniref:Sugar kinase of the NBD/HSP70 family, may contain an N-terminal HTH domain n=2 Tax=Agreia pratensis TaxID=150121 RepID=A0A1X7J011_9MICO|nr:Sugar kinase of the NBD/HSP70 family, may contain an N-terminal HTH domain [Agreia pratensis]